jgi:ureidoacrylate peracid hydrolase
MKSLADRVEPRQCTLIVVDVQNDFCHQNGSMAKAGQDLSMVQQMVPRLLRLIAEARRVGVPIIYTQAVHTPWTDSQTWQTRLGTLEVELPRHCRENTWGADFYQVAPLQDERILVKRRYSAFYGTELDLMLRARGIQTLILTGVATNVCVETTARDGFMRDYHIVFLEDCTAAYDQQQHQAALANVSSFFGQVASSQQLLEIWGRLPPVSREE